MSHSGKTLGAFVVEREVGRGGMGIVLLARQTSLDRPAVLKKLRRELSDDPALGARFEREARAAASVHHQNVVAVYDCFLHRGDRYIAQEYVDGIDLRSALAKSGPLPWRIAALIALEAARGLEEIHARGTVHRDLKPANLLLGRKGEVKIADFGIALEASGASLTQPGIVLGSPPYMPPEQMRGERLDARGDLFAFGTVLYEMLAGRPPYVQSEGEETGSLLTRMQKERFPALRRLAPRAPRALARLSRGCLRAKPRARIASATRVRRLLERLLGRPSSADCRSELASWGWERGIFEARPNETVVRVAAPTAEPLPWKRRTVGALLATAALAGSVWIVDARREATDSPRMAAPAVRAAAARLEMALPALAPLLAASPATEAQEPSAEGPPSP